MSVCWTHSINIKRYVGGFGRAYLVAGGGSSQCERVPGWRRLGRSGIRELDRRRIRQAAGAGQGVVQILCGRFHVEYLNICGGNIADAYKKALTNRVQLIKHLVCVFLFVGCCCGCVCVLLNRDNRNRTNKRVG